MRSISLQNSAVLANKSNGLTLRSPTTRANFSQQVRIPRQLFSRLRPARTYSCFLAGGPFS